MSCVIPSHVVYLLLKPLTKPLLQNVWLMIWSRGRDRTAHFSHNCVGTWWTLISMRFCSVYSWVNSIPDHNKVSRQTPFTGKIWNINGQFSVLPKIQCAQDVQYLLQHWGSTQLLESLCNESFIEIVHYRFCVCANTLSAQKRHAWIKLSP